MKIFLAMLLAVTTNQLTDEQLGDKLTQAIILARVGLFDEAEAACKEVLAQKPDQPTVKQLLAEIVEQKHKRETLDLGRALHRKLEELTLPEVNFRSASPRDIVKFLAEQSARQSADKTAINFVWLVPEDAALKPVTLNLKRVPMSDVLDYLTQLAGLKYRVDARAVVIYKPEPEKPIPPATEPNAKP